MAQRHSPTISSAPRCGIACLLGLLGLILVQPMQAAPPVPADHVERAKAGTKLFKEQIRAVLVQQCLECHGGQSVKGDFDLSTREKLFDSGFIDQTAADSYLVELIEHRAEPHMPLKAPKLPIKVIEQIRRWIDLGAPYDAPLTDGTPTAGGLVVTDEDRQFWSFQPLRAVTPPEVSDGEWCRTDIDRFILGRLEAEGIQPNRPADRRTLIRRVSLDLTGLPPTYEASEAFVQDESPDAYAKLIDQLLASPQYGERWARHWMDVARFAESHGYEQDYDRRTAYHYRDFLIRALNDDMPFNQFVAWQLAGDELAPDDPEALKATGFIGAGAFPTQLTEEEFESARYDELDDIVATTGVAFLGLSTGCARCHDHKYDPISAKDYYRLASNFTKAIRTEVELDLDPQANGIAQTQFETKRKELEQHQAELLPRIQQEFLAWLSEEENALQHGPWEVIDISQVTSSAGTTYQQQPDGSWLAQGDAPNQEVLTIQGRFSRHDITALRLEALTDESLPRKGPGRAGNGNFALGDIRISLAASPESNVAIKAARATHQQNDSELSVAASFDDDPISGWAVDAGGIGKDQAAVFDLASAVTLSDQTELQIVLTFNHPNGQHALGRFRLSVTDHASPAAELHQSGPPANVIDAIAALRMAPVEQRTPEHKHWQTAFDWYRDANANWKSLTDQLAALNKNGPQLKLTKVLITSEGLPHLSHHADGRGFPHFYPETYFLTR
ncbi:MAG: DUF1549 domain-containing protein, partial [Planctomycetaceae bacterium]|nr:DUF1549 domain-containing protein [Planctomycetaceae bacterium]